MSSLLSTLSPTANPLQTTFDDDDDDEEEKENQSYQFEPIRSTTSPSTSPSLAVTPSYGALSMSLEELSVVLGGLGRAKLVWDCYSIGVDPALFFGSLIQLGYDDYETIYDLLPTCRRQQRLATSTLQTLSHTYGGGRVEGGVARLCFISQSSDRTTKLLLKLADGLDVETVIIPSKNGRSTLCISSQVGCRQGCTFCATGRMGKLRSLTSDEILSQMFFARKICRLYDLPAVTNVVFMGMGEPADNADAVIRACHILTSRSQFQLSRTKVTVSTVAPTPDAFRVFAAAPCVLAWSVHAVNDDLRRKLVPTTKYSMHELRDGFVSALQSRPPNARTAMIEVVLIAGVNDGLEQANELAEFCREISDTVSGSKIMVNLIPFNDIGHGVYQRPTRAAVLAFQKQLWARGVFAHVRVTRGDDATAACGQLATNKKLRP